MTVSVSGNVLTDAADRRCTTPRPTRSADRHARPSRAGTADHASAQPFTTAGGGVLTLTPTARYTFEPGTAYNGLDAGETATETITYTVTDGNGGTATATLVITITGGNDAPVIIDPANPGTPANPVARHRSAQHHPRCQHHRRRDR